jgi:GntR family transcriptional regulator
MSEPPPYLVIAARLRKRIAEGEWAPGQRLPSRARFAEEYDVGDNVVRRAQELLIAEGLLEGRAGSGTFVAEPRARLSLVRSWHEIERNRSSFEDTMAAATRRGGREVECVGKVPAPPDIAARLRIEEGAFCVRTVYEVLSGGRTVELCTSWEPYHLTSGTTEVLPNGGPHRGEGVVARMAAIGITVSHAIEEIEPRKATPVEAARLGIQKNSLVTHIRRTHVAEDDRRVETADIVVPSTKCQVIYEIPITGPHSHPAP